MSTENENWLEELINDIGHFFASLFDHAKKLWNSLPKDQQDDIISGVSVSQILKEGYTKGEDAIVSEIAAKLGMSEDVARGVVLQVGKDYFGIDFPKVQDVLDKFADKIQAGVTDNKWNAIWEDVAKFAASWLSTGKLNWVTLGMGVIQIALQLFVKGK